MEHLGQVQPAKVGRLLVIDQFHTNSLCWMDHPELGRIALQNSPLRFHDSPLMPIEPSADLGAHNREIYGEWLGIAADELDAMERDGVI